MTRGLFVALVVLAMTPIVRSDDKKNGDQKMHGAWLATSAELAGQKFPDEILKTIKLTVEDDKYTVMVGTQPDRGTLKLDTAAKPKTVDIVSTEGANKGKTFLAIYEQDGDTLRICYDLSGKARPKDFGTKAGTQLFLVTYKKSSP